MLSNAIKLTLGQVPHPTFRKVFFLGLLMAAVVLAACIIAMRMQWPEGFLTGWEWLDQWLLGWAMFAVLASIGSYFLFPPVAMVFMGVMLDQVIEAVEDEHYPDRRPTRKVTLGENTIIALKQGLLVLVINVLALVIYIPLFLISGGLLAAAFYITLNGYLIGREYFDMVAVRFMTPRDARHMRRDNRDKAFMGGVAVAGMFLVPGLNLAAPVLGAALMTHMVHAALNNEVSS